MSAIGGKADVRELPAVCPLIARSGHSTVAADATREAGEDRCQGRRSRALRHLSVGRGCCAEEPVSRNLEADRRIATTATDTSVNGGRRRIWLKEWCVRLTTKLAGWAAGHGHLTKICLSNGFGGKTIPVVAKFGCGRNEFEGYLVNVR